MKISASESLACRKGPPAWFSGEVWLDDIVTGGSPALLKATRLSFAPGARTAWHTHPLGQALHVVSGMGWVQLKGEPARAIRPGDSVWIEPGEVHWHGATANRTMVHLAMQNADEYGVDVVWLEHVSDVEYGESRLPVVNE
jgi:quercetin dioxygenase-like cupin family protein